MKRFHVHAHVTDLPASIAFYSKLFAAQPARVEADYAKWMLEDPRLNFAISTRGNGQPGVDHLGLQAESDEELVELKDRARAADMAMLDEGETSCCYARSDKYWLTDPQGIAWEQFHTLGTIPVFGEAPVLGDAQAPSGAAGVAGSAGVAEVASGCCAGAKPVTVPASVPISFPVKPAKPASSCC